MLPRIDISDQDLGKMSDDALAQLEDQLLLDNELDLSKDARLSAGRAVVWFLSVVFIVILMGLYSRLPTEKLGPLNIPLYLGVLAVGAWLGHKTWRAAGQRIREVIRWLMGHWPLVIFIAFQINRLLRGG